MNKLLITIFLSLFIGTHSFGQLKAVTEKGDTIFVYDDGTWSFEEEERVSGLDEEFSFLNEVLQIDSVDTKFSFGEDANKEIESQFKFFKIKYDSELWKRVPPASFNPEAEFAFKAKGKDIFCVIISEEIEIGQENIVKIARKMMRDNTGSAVTPLKTEARNVNGVDLIRAVNAIDLNGMNLVFDSYYFSDPSGTVQFSVWTAKNLYGKYESDIVDLLNGLVILK